MKTSMLKTRACKHESTSTKMAERYKTTTATPYGPRRSFEVSIEREGRNPLTARFGGISLRRKKHVIRRRELVTRLQAGRCEFCKQAGKSLGRPRRVGIVVWSAARVG